jgi:hypothetical protein
LLLSPRSGTNAADRITENSNIQGLSHRRKLLGNPTIPIPVTNGHGWSVAHENAQRHRQLSTGGR